ncbi:Retrovirus-related Pol polyprotein from transposon TNT 1-94 [Vitis vinifera]|uniref:Retrovirus-related Pol polyprotein from transposon TNT 1-94 n=1 Tax=Vitis vinifera TaxID=29760 RepID=A0A438DNF9_VITVI|nr:Retrovirus-related Pol polyprotein from transposon TNT 1-94 [Vitis vinifera]
MPLPLLLGHLIVVVEIIRNGIGLGVIIVRKLGHYKEACWKLHGKPADWKPKPRFDRDGRAHMAANSESTSVPEPSPFNKEQMEMLQKLLSQVGSGNTTRIAFTANRGGMKSWIVDTSASDHMTGDAAILQNYKPSSINLLKTCFLTLFSIFQTWIDLKSGKMISSAELCSGLYLLPCGQFSNQVSQASCVQSQILKSDNAKEYFTSSLSTYLQNHDIIHISSCVDTPQQNGVAERKNKHLLEVARCLMFSSNVPNYFWGEAILTATYLINRMPSRVLTFQSPRQLLLKKFPHTRASSSDLPLKVFGCTTFVHLYPQNRSKFAPRANKCIFLGYSPTQKGYKCYSPTNKRFYTTMNVFLFEHVFFYPKSHVQGESMNEHQVWESLLEIVPFSHSESPNPSQSAPTELSTPMPSSVQPTQPTNVPSPELEHGSQPTCGQYIDSISSLPEENIDHPIGNYVTYEGLSLSYRAFATSLDDTQVPNTIQEAFKISEWKKAVQDEIDALEKNGTWTITDLFGWEEARGETFALDAKLNTIRILLSLAINQDWCLQQLDIKNAFLNGDLEEEVYMEIPPGFEGSMAKNQADHTLFVQKSHAGKMTILIVYVDDIILSGNDMEELQNLKKYLSEEFEVKDLGNLKYFLGMEVARSRKGIVVSQRKYILDLLKETGMLGCKPIDTPMDSQKKLGIEKESTPIDRGRYQSKKQSVVARSSAEAEYRALAQGICEGIWIKRVLSELGQTSSSPILMMCDNQAAISIAKNPVYHDKTKHVEIDRHFITEKVTSETVN